MDLGAAQTIENTYVDTKNLKIVLIVNYILRAIGLFMVLPSDVAFPMQDVLGHPFSSATHRGIHKQELGNPEAWR